MGDVLQELDEQGHKSFVIANCLNRMTSEHAGEFLNLCVFMKRTPTRTRNTDTDNFHEDANFRKNKNMEKTKNGATGLPTAPECFLGHFYKTT